MPIAGLAAWLLALAAPLAKRVMVALGFGVISYGAVTTAFDGAKAAFLGLYQGIPSDLLFMVELSGLHQAIGIIFAAMAARLGLAAVARWGRVAS